MKFSLDTGGGARYVSAYREGALRIGERVYEGHLFLLPDAVLEWPGGDIATLGVEALEPLLAHDPEILLLGTGARQVFPPFELFAEFSRRGVGFEVMDTAAACRTFNVLLSEDRRVAAALIV